MEDTLQHFECESCGAEFAIQTDMDVDIQYCPYCGELMTILTWVDDESNNFG